MATVVIRDERLPRQLEGEMRLEGISEQCTLRDLIRTRVREEVARANAGPGKEFRMLVQPKEAEATLNGYTMRAPRHIDWEAQAQVAEQSFVRKGFLVIVGDRQVEDLEEELDLGVETEIRFVRLVPLVGG
jgi:hypothetical protein